MTLQTRFTYDDLLAMPGDGNRAEIDDADRAVSPPPTPAHQAIVLALGITLAVQLERGAFRVRLAPLTIRLARIRPSSPMCWC